MAAEPFGKIRRQQMSALWRRPFPDFRIGQGLGADLVIAAIEAGGAIGRGVLVAIMSHLFPNLVRPARIGDLPISESRAGGGSDGFSKKM